jgi:hypothetical protein
VQFFLFVLSWRIVVLLFSGDIYGRTFQMFHFCGEKVYKCNLWTKDRCAEGEKSAALKDKRPLR